MAETATIARPYAEALFKATGDGAADDALRWLDPLADVARQPQLLTFASDPNIRDEQVFDLISGIVQGDGGGNGAAALPQAAQNFLRIVIDNKRLAVLPEIAGQFRELSNQRSGRSDAVVYSAFPIDGPALDDLSGLLEKRFNQKLNLSIELQPELIGGIRIVVGDEVLDTSVKARLEQMKLALTS